MEVKKMEQRNPLGYEKPEVLLRRFAIPSIIAMLVSSLYNIIDQIFIGQGVGYLGNAATNVAFPLSTICLAISLLIGIGAGARFSLELGSGEGQKAGHYVGNALWMVGVIGIVYVILIEIFLTPLLKAFGATPNILPDAISYASITALGMPFLIFINVMGNLIRADGSPKYSMTCMVVGAVVNTILDPIFIFVFHLGVKGAAIATVISQLVSFGFAFKYLWRFEHVEFMRECFRPQLRKCVMIASLGMSNCMTQLAITVVQIVMNNSLTYYGEKTIYGADIPLSGFGIVMKVNAIFISIFVGLSQGSQPILGFNYGAHQYSRVKAIYKLALKYSLIFGAVGFALFQIFPYYIISLFGSGNELYMEFAVKFMRIFLFMVLVIGVQIISSNFFAAIGMPAKGVVLSLSRQFFFLIPLILILPVFLGIDGIMYAGPISDTIAFIVSVLFIRREFHKMDEA